jgi:hypothetical protein
MNEAEMPVLYVPVGGFRAMKMITNFTAKIGSEDISKVEKAIQLVEENIDFNTLCNVS